jgi:serine/threonine-protein kinase
MAAVDSAGEWRYRYSSPTGEPELECPKCRADNPDSSRFCGLCATPLLGAETETPRPSAPSSRPPASVTPPVIIGPRPSPCPDDSPSLTTTIDPIARGLAVGSVVAGKYRLLSEIGRGGMGIVYEADDLKLRRPVALKFLPTEYTDDAEARERFVHEARAASVLDNPHICTIHEIGESADGRMFIAMALCRGESLRARVKRGPLAPAEALSIAAQVAAGLGAAHAGGIIHRDVKPGNILVSSDGVARIADFGLAKIAGEARLTRTGRAVGTVAYMSPEQLRGEDVDARTDVWSLGVVLYEMLTGRLPFHGSTEHSLAFAIVNGEPKPLDDLPPGVPAGCARILEKALAKNRAERFASAVEMSEALTAVRETSGLSGSRRTGAGEWGSRSATRPAVIRFGLPVVLAAAAVYAAFALSIPRKVGTILGLGPGPGEGKRITIFVPTVLAGTPEDQVLASGLAEHLRRGLDMIARRTRSWITPEEHAAGYEVRVAADARAILGSNIVVSGTLKRSGDNLTLTLDAVDPASLTRLFSLTRSDSIANISTWQRDLVLEAADELGLVTSPGDKAALTAAGTTVPGAFSAYLLGLGHMTSLYASPGADSASAYDAAIAALELTLSLDPSFAVAGIDLAEVYRLKSRFTGDPAWAGRAETQARSALESNDRLAYGHHILAAVLRRLGRNEDALAELERAHALDPYAYDTLIRLGTLFEEMNQPAKAEAAYREALRVRPDYWAALSSLAYFHFVQGDYDKARDQFEAVTRICPGSFYALNALGAAYFKLGDYPRAMSAFERSNAVKKNADACSNLGVIYYYSGRYADSVMANENAISLGASELGYLVYGNLADAYHFTPGNEARAVEAYRKAIDLVEKELAADPNNARVRSSLAVFLAKGGEPQRAASEMERALKALPDDAGVVLKAAIVYELGGTRPLALDAVREYVRLKGPVEEINMEPFLAGLRQDPGYSNIVEGKSVRAGRGGSR